MRTVDIYSAGCPICEEAIQMVHRIACDSCDVRVLDLNDTDVAEQAATLGVRSVPAVAVDGELAACCTDRGISEEALRAAGIGQPIS